MKDLLFAKHPDFANIFYNHQKSASDYPDYEFGRNGKHIKLKIGIWKQM